jgi:hypothetical protein
MKTTVHLPDDALRQLKSLERQRGVSLKQLLGTAVEKELSTAHEYRVTLPILDSKEPGTLNLTNVEIEQLTLP